LIIYFILNLGTSLTDISKIIGAEWKKLTEEQKDVSKENLSKYST